MKILLAHHLEPIWNDGLKRFGMNIYILCERIAEYLSEGDFDKIIISQFELARNPQSEECYFPILQVIEDSGIKIEWQEYSYGWTLESFNLPEDALNEDGFAIDEYGRKIVEGGSHSEVLPLEKWIADLFGHEVYLCGAFDGECLEDISLAMRACGVEFSRVENLIV